MAQCFFFGKLEGNFTFLIYVTLKWPRGGGFHGTQTQFLAQSAKMRHNLPSPSFGIVNFTLRTSQLQEISNRPWPSCANQPKLALLRNIPKFVSAAILKRITFSLILFQQCDCTYNLWANFCRKILFRKCFSNFSWEFLCRDKKFGYLAAILKAEVWFLNFLLCLGSFDVL